MKAYVEVKSIEMGGMDLRSSDLVPVEDSVAVTTSSRCPDKKMKVVLDGMQLILDGNSRCLEEAFEVSIA